MTDEERPHAVALGVELAALRADRELTLRELGGLATLTGGHLSALERGLRRTRRSTLVRIVAALVVDEDQRAEEVERLVAVAGPALAAESTFAERVERRRARNAARYRRDAEATMRRIVRDARSLPASSPLAEASHRLADRVEADLVDRPVDRNTHACAVAPVIAEPAEWVGLSDDERERLESIAHCDVTDRGMAARRALMEDDRARREAARAARHQARHHDDDLGEESPALATVGGDGTSCTTSRSAP